MTYTTIVTGEYITDVTSTVKVGGHKAGRRDPIMVDKWMNSSIHTISFIHKQ